MFVLLLIIPLLTAIIAVVAFRWAFYGIRHNKWGVRPKQSHYLPIIGKHHDRSAGSPLPDKKHHVLHNKHGEKDIIGWPEDRTKRRKVLIATLEYELIDWKLKVKIGGLGVMSSLMGKAMSDVDLIWVVPKVKDLEYPPGDPAEPIEVIIFGEPYLIEVETHTLDNITWVILESPVFRAQTKADPYPARMDDLSSAIFYSTWNQAIAATIRRYPGHRHLSRQRLPRCTGSHIPPAQSYPRLFVPAQRRVPGFVAAADERGDEGGVLGVQHQQGALHQVRAVREHVQPSPCRGVVH
jgi:alpha-1,3-glucan synthase